MKHALVFITIGLLSLMAARSAPVNLAPSGTASASSAGWGASITDGNDGNRNGAFGAGSVWHTAPEDAGPFWYAVDLGATYYLDQVRIYPRTDMRQHTVAYIRIRVLDANDNEVWSGDYLPANAADYAWGTSDLRGVQGRKVVVERLAGAPAGTPNFFTFAEFEVWGQGTPIAPNLALNKLINNSDGDPAGAKAIDGNLDGDNTHLDQPVYISASTGPGVFWEVDLESAYELGYIFLYNQVDAATTSEAVLSVLNEAYAPIYSTNLNLARTQQDLGADRYGLLVDLPKGLRGRWVRLENTLAEPLALAEVEVFPRTTDIISPTVTTLGFQSTTNLLATLNFSEALEPETAANPANYVFTGGPVVSSAALLPSGTTVILAIDKLPPNTAYALRVAGVKDKAGNALAATNFSGTVGFYELNWARGGTASASSTGWGGVPERANDGGTDSDFNHASVYHSNTQTGDWWEVDLGEARDVGQVRVWLRTDANAAPGNSNLTVTVYDESQTEIWRGTYPGNPLTATPATNMFAFTFGPALQARYVRVDNSITPFWFALAEVEVIAPYTNVSLTITKQPADQVAAENHAATFGPVGASFQGAPQNALTVQWLANGTNIPGANTLSYTTPILSLTDSGQEFQAVFLYSGVTLTSSVVKLTVIPDREPPRVAAVVPELVQGTSLLRVQFDELIETTTAGEFWNYTALNGILLESVTLGNDGRSVVLGVSGLDAQLGYYVVRIENVQDLVGNIITATNVAGHFPISSLDVALASGGAVATSSSVGWSGVPERAIDGNTDGNYNNGSVCHSATGDATPWLNVDFGALKTIGLVQVWWRTDGGLHGRDINYTIKLLDEASAVVWSYQFDGLPPYPSAAVAVPGVPARYVQLEPQRNQFLHVAEVEAFEPFAVVRLNLQREGQNVVLSWPTTVTGFVLEATDTLVGGAWREVAGVVNNSVKLSANSARQFYRLRLP